MRYEKIAEMCAREPGVEISTMMKSPCLRYYGDFVAMMFEQEDSLVVKLPSDRVDAMIASGEGLEFNFTKKTFREWALIPRQYEDKYQSLVYEALDYAKGRKRPN